MAYSPMMMDQATVAELRERQLQLSAKDEMSASEQREWKLIDAEVTRRAEQAPIARTGGLQQEGKARSKRPRSLCYLDQRTGEWVTARNRDEVAADTSTIDAPSLGGMIKGALTGNWRGLEREHAAVVGDQDSSGGFLVSEATSQQLIGYAFNKTVLAQAGMRMIPFPANADSLRIPRVLSPPTAYWLAAQGTALTASSPTFEAIVLQPRVLGVLVPVSLEFLSDVAGAQQAIEEVISQAIATEIDRAILYGTGASGEPGGLSTMTGVVKAPAVGAWTIDTVIGWLETMWNSNCPREGLSMILDSDAEAHRIKLKTGEADYYVTSNNPISFINYLMTENVVSTDLFLGDFNRLILGVKDNLRVEVLPAGTASDASGNSYNATSELYRWIRVYSRLDFACEKPEHITYASGLTNA